MKSQNSPIMHWWCHRTWHQRKLFWVSFSFFFLKTAGTNSSFVARKLKINHLPSHHLLPRLLHGSIYYSKKRRLNFERLADVENGLCLCDTLQVEVDGIIKAAPHCMLKFLKSSLSFENTSNQIKSGKYGWRLFVHHPVSSSFVLILLPVSLSAHILGSTSTLHAYSKRMKKKEGKQLKRHCALVNLEHYNVDKAKVM